MGPNNKTILLVEDEAIIALAESKTLERHGYNVITAGDGPQAIDAARKNGDAIDLILMDIDLGRGMDGTEAAQAILRNRDIPVVFLSSHTEQAIVEKTDTITSYGYVTKNSGETVLIASLKMAFRLYSAYRDVQRHRTEAEASYKDLKTANEELEASNEDLVQSEQELIERETIIRNIIDNLPLGIHQYRIENGGRLVFERANPAADLILGVGNSQFIGKTIEEAFPGLASTDVPDRYRLVCTSGTPWHTEQIEYEDGKIKGAFEVHAFQTEPGRMVTLFRDITERKLISEALRESEEKFRGITERLRDMIFTTDALGLITYVSPSGYALFRHKPEEMMGHNFIEYLDKSEIGKAEEKFRQALSTGISQSSVTLTMKRSDGSLFQGELVSSIQFKGTAPHRTLGIIRDVTELKRIDQTLQERELLLRRITDNMLDVIILVDHASNVRYASPSLATVLGYKPDEMIGKSVFDFIHQEDLKSIFEAYQEDIKSLRPGKVEFRCLHRDGHFKWMEGNVNPLIGDGGDLAGGVISLRDISESKMIAEILANALKEKEGLLRELQHRVKNSFAIITGIVSLEMDRHRDPASNRVLADVRNRISSLANLYDILHHANNVKEIALDSYLASLCQSLIDSYSIDPERIKPSMRFDKIIIDVRRAIPIGLIVNELLTNAIKYAFPGKSGGEIGICLGVVDDFLLLRVSDNGAGLPLSTTLENSKGLGLELVRLLVKQLEGTIELVINQGTTFSIMVPNSDSEP